MNRKHNAELTQRAKILRKNMTKEERHLWYDFLREYPLRFLRQKVIDRYIVDFYCPKLNLIIEVDGWQHEILKKEYDDKRTEYLKNVGFSVLRIDNQDVNYDFNYVGAVIRKTCKQKAEEYGVEFIDRTPDRDNFKEYGNLE